MLYTVKVEKNKRTVSTYTTRSIRRFSSKLSFTFTSKMRVYLRFTYGRVKDAFGKKPIFTNEGWYNSKKDLMQAYEAFKEARGYLNP